MSEENITCDSRGVTLAGSYRHVASPVSRSQEKIMTSPVSTEPHELIAVWLTGYWGRS